MSKINEQFSNSQAVLCVQDENILEIAAQLVVVKSEADDKLVLDIAGDVVDFYLSFEQEGFLLEEQRADFDVFRSLLMEKTCFDDDGGTLSQTAKP